MNNEPKQTNHVCSGSCKSADIKDCLNIHAALKELEYAIRTDLDDTGYKKYSDALTHITMNAVINWFYENVEKIKLVEGGE